MKQLTMTPELSALIQARVGVDVDTSQLAVFETIALNTNPLPGKAGTIWEQAVAQPITLKEMVDSIVAGNHIPLIADHEMWGTPKGRAFHAGLDYEDGALSMRMLFYLDPSEAPLIQKLNAGSLDEVSVAFLSRSLNCSECGWDYISFGSSDNIYARTCGNGHVVGSGGVHVEMSGLGQFIELSLVARGAADSPKIVGKSQAKLAPEPALALAAKGFEPNALVVEASRGNSQMDLTAALTQVATLSTEKGALTANLSTVTGERDAARTELTAARGTIAERDTAIATLTSERDAALSADGNAVSERDAALALLGDQFDRLTVAGGKTKVEGDARPKTVAEFKAKIEELTAGLVAILPTGGVSQGAGDDKNPTKLTSAPASAFALRK